MSAAGEVVAPPRGRTTLFAFVATGLLIFAAIAIHWPTATSLVAIWLRSDTFAHGILVLPATLYLVYRNWRDTGGVALTTSTWALAGFALATAAWVLSTIADVQVGQQFALVVLLPLGAWLMLGGRFMRSMTFPLVFLIFAVPFGEGLIPLLMDFTAWFTVIALQLTGIPVYREGMFLSIPSGDFEVAKACSGIRYLIGSLSLGSLYAYLTFRSYWRRAVFIAAAAIVPIIANGIRAYLIVLIAHISDLKLAVGVDHLVYGWLFFGLVMFLLFMVGRVFRDNDVERSEHAGTPMPVASPAPSRLIAVAVPALAIVAFGPLFYERVEASAQATSLGFAPRMPAAAAGWEGPLPVEDSWRPDYYGATVQLAGRYRHADGDVTVHVVGYQRQTQDAELINNENQMFDAMRWRLIDDTRLKPEGLPVDSLRQLTLRQGREALQLWYWYRTGGANTTSEYAVKWTEVREILGGRADSATLVAIGVRRDIDDDANRLLGAFVAAHGEAMFACIDEPADAVCAR